MPWHWRTTLQPPDVDAVRQLVAATGVFNPEETGVAAELAAESLENGAASGYAFLLAGQDNRLAGYSCYGRIPFTNARYDLYWIAIHPDFQGQGLGRALMEKTEALIRREEGVAIYADTSSRAPYRSAHRLYTHCGYRQEARLADYYRDGDDRLTFVKHLTAIV